MKKLSFVCALCVSVLSVNTALAGEGALSGKFTINNEGDKVQFSQGNLQYQASTKTWRFAEHQWDIIGDDNANIAADYTGWIDLFGWGTGNNPTNSSKDFSPTGEYAEFTEWGTNAISNGGNAANVWRSMTQDEWNHIIVGREGAQNLLGPAKIGTVEGHVLLPDGFVLPAGLTFDPQDATKNVYDAAAWSKMEQAGAVFMPYAGVRYGTEVFFVGEDAQYWTSSCAAGKTIALIMYNRNATLSTNDRNGGMAIRLVCKAAEPAPSKPIPPSQRPKKPVPPVKK